MLSRCKDTILRAYMQVNRDKKAVFTQFMAKNARGCRVEKIG